MAKLNLGGVQYVYASMKINKKRLGQERSVLHRKLHVYRRVGVITRTSSQFQNNFQKAQRFQGEESNICEPQI